MFNPTENVCNCETTEELWTHRGNTVLVRKGGHQNVNLLQRHSRATRVGPQRVVAITVRFKPSNQYINSYKRFELNTYVYVCVCTRDVN